HGSSLVRLVKGHLFPASTPNDRPTAFVTRKFGRDGGRARRCVPGGRKNRRPPGLTGWQPFLLRRQVHMPAVLVEGRRCLRHLAERAGTAAGGKGPAAFTARREARKKQARGGCRACFGRGRR